MHGHIQIKLITGTHITNVEHKCTPYHTVYTQPVIDIKCAQEVTPMHRQYHDSLIDTHSGQSGKSYRE